MSRSLPVFQSLDELDDDEPGGKDRKEEEELVQANTFQNEAMIADPVTGHLMVSSHMTWKDWRDWRDLESGFYIKNVGVLLSARCWTQTDSSRGSVDQEFVWEATEVKMCRRISSPPVVIRAKSSFSESAVKAAVNNYLQRYSVSTV